MARIRNIEDPLLSQDVATKNYVDTHITPNISAGYVFTTAGNPLTTTNNNSDTKLLSNINVFPVLVNFSCAPGSNRLIYTGTSSSLFNIICVISFAVASTTPSSRTTTTTFIIYKNGSPLNSGAFFATVPPSFISSLNNTPLTVQGISTLNQNDYLEVYATTVDTSANNITALISPYYSLCAMEL